MMRRLISRLIGFWIRREACRMTALAMQNHTADDPLCPRAWSIAVFFELYMRHGSEGTQDDFGPKEPAELKAVEPGRNH